MNTDPEILQSWGEGVEHNGAWILLHTLPSYSVSCRLQAVVPFQILGLQPKDEDLYNTFING